MKRYNPKEIEPKWQHIWADDKIYEAKDGSDKPKQYVLEYFPYPSGAAMHVGHVRNYAIGDAITRFARMRGRNVLHPMGWDAFGLPAENYAIKTGISPQQAIQENTAKFRRQLTQMGFGYDWSREVTSSDPNYYKWTQWLFLLLHKRGLAYRKESLQWWCPVDKTVLANEQVENGLCWRCGSVVEKKALPQWFFKITDYADRLERDLDNVDWTDGIKNMQRNWIGRSVGAEIDFALDSTDNYVLLHGYSGSSQTSFFPWTKERLQHAGADVFMPDLPDTNNPDAEAQAAFVLDNTQFGENTVLLGHSYGSVTALKILEKLEQPIKKLVLVAGFAQPGFADRKRIFEDTTSWTFDFEKIKRNVGEVVILRDSTDLAVPAERADFLQEKLGGTIVDFAAEGSHVSGEVEPVVLQHLKPSIKIFTTRPDTVYGATFMVLAPEHPLAKQIATDEQRAEVNDYVKQAQAKSDIERQETGREKTGVFTGAFATNPANGEKIPVWVADYVLYGYGTGAIMAVPAHDERDHVFAKKFNLPIVPVVATMFREYDEQAADRPSVIAVAHDPKLDRYCVIHWNEDHFFRKQGYVWPGGGIDQGESVEDAALREFREETGYTDATVDKTLPAVTSTYYNDDFSTGIRSVRSIVLLTMNSLQRDEQFTGDDYEKDAYEVLWLSKKEIQKKLNPEYEWNTIAEYAWGETLHVGEGSLINSGPYNNMRTGEAREKIVAELEAKGMAELRTNYKIRDWLISRQRYWGAPIPMVHCKKCGTQPVPEDQLPVVLPEMQSYEPSGDGRSPLARAADWVNTTCPKCDGPGMRETDTMDGFACSSWYFLRFADPHNSDKAFSDDKAKYWLPVDDYIGGAEHAVMHLLYARFWTKVMYDAGLIDFQEPFTTLRNQGMILAPDGQKMSKSKGNTIEPDHLIEQGYGADAIRIMELFIGPWNQQANWSVEGMGGSYRFLQRIWTLAQEYINHEGEAQAADDLEIKRVMHRAIHRVSKDLEEMGFNTAIAALMETVNDLYKLKAALPYRQATDTWKWAVETLLQLVAPFAPHIAEELWHQLGHTDSIHTSQWPVQDEQYLVSDTITIVVQVNGKVRAQLQLPADASKEDILAQARQNEKVAAYLQGKEPSNSIYVPGKLVNFVAR